jgi:tetratricopeptide (TPR) repeat protein
MRRGKTSKKPAFSLSLPQFLRQGRMIGCKGLFLGFVMVALAMPAHAGEASPELQARLDKCMRPQTVAAVTAAIDVCTALLAEKNWGDAKLAGIYASRANAYDYTGDRQKALDDYAKAIELDATNADIFYNRGYCYMSARDYSHAKADFEKAIQLDPKYWAAHFNRGIIAEEEGDFSKALDSFDHTIALNPTMALAYFHRAIAYGRLGQNDKMVADIGTAVRLDPALKKQIHIEAKPAN